MSKIWKKDVVDLELIYANQVSKVLDLLKKLQTKIKFQDLAYCIISTISDLDEDEIINLDSNFNKKDSNTTCWIELKLEIKIKP